MFPESVPDCPYTNLRNCDWWVQGYQDAIVDADAGGYLNNASVEPDQVPFFLSLSDAQTLLPAITLVLATAFGARLIIQLVKG